ncbi:MAG: DNA polymerase III subunit beta [Christensenella sp.]
MKIICNREELLEVLNGVSKAVSSKSSIPALEGILFKTAGEKVILTAYDLEIGIISSFDAQVDEDGEIVMNARLLIEMIRKIDSDRVSIETDVDLKIVIKGGITKFNFVGIPASDYPEMPIPDTESTLSVSSTDLKEMISKTIYAVSLSDQKPVHTGTKFIIDDNGLTLVSVDGYRLAVCNRKKIGIFENKSFIVPGKTLSEVSKLIGEKKDDVSIGTERRYAVFKLNNYTVVTRLLEGDFLDYKKSIPEGYRTRVKIDVRTMCDSIERASLIINERFKSPIKFFFEDNIVTLNCTTALGNAYDEFKCEMDGESVEIGFNNKYILDALRNSDCDDVYLEINGSGAPMKVLPVEGDEFVFLVLPVRIKV